MLSEVWPSARIGRGRGCVSLTHLLKTSACTNSCSSKLVSIILYVCTFTQYHTTVCMYGVVLTIGLYILYNVLFSKFDLCPLLMHSTPAVPEMYTTCTIQHANKVCAPSTSCMRLFLVFLPCAKHTCSD